jgi:hypothetical protein
MSGLLGPLPRIGTLHNAVVLVSCPESLLGAAAFWARSRPFAVLGCAEAERNAIAEAQKIVAIWNARQAGGGALVLSDDRPPRSQELPWLSFSCPACGQFGAVYLRTLDRHRARRFLASSRRCPAGGARPTHCLRGSKVLRWISQPPIFDRRKTTHNHPPCAVRSPARAAGFPPIITVAEALAMLSGGSTSRPL